MVNAIILAGSETSQRWKEAGNKALIKINDRLMIDFIIDALRGTGSIGKIVVVGPKAVLAGSLKHKADEVVDSDGGIMDNVMAGIKYFGDRDGLLVCSCDIPFITSEAINDFIMQSKSIKADLCYPIIEMSVSKEKFPEFRRTYASIKDGSFTGGNVFYINPEAVARGYDLAVRLLDARKKPFKMARILGPGFLLGLLLKNLSVAKIEEKITKVLNIKARAIISGYAEIGNDVDKTEDVAVAAAYLNRIR